MALTERQKQTVLGALKERIRGGCPMCLQANWTIHNEVVSTMTASLGGDTTIGGGFVPMIQIICNNCGFVSHHAVGLLGISLNE